MNGMSPAGSRVTTSCATVTVLASAGFLAAFGEPVGALACLACGGAVAVGWLIVHHDPASPVGPALAWSTADIALITAHVGPLGKLPWAAGAWPLNLAGLLALMLVFPSGRLRGRWWRMVPWMFAAATVGMVAALWGARQVGGRVVGGPTADWLKPVGAVSLLTVGACLILGASSLVVRYRSGDARTRRQIRWLILAGIIVVVLLVAGWGLELAGASLGVAYTPFLVAIVVLVPAAVGVAIVRQDLFDVDRLLSDATAWLVTLVLSAGVFGAVVYAASHVVSAGTGVSSTVAAFVTALVFIPMERHVASWVGRLVNRDRQVAVATIERFASDVRLGKRQPEEIEAVLRQVQDDPDLEVQLLRPDGSWVRVDGTAAETSEGFAIEAGGDIVARVRLGWDSARARHRIADVAKVAWVPLEVSRLRLVLREALGEAEASRARLAEATSAERRRLERDLHDGAQQRIVATGMRLRLLQERLAPDDAQEVDAAVAELGDTVNELRRVAHGVRPRQLDDGLAAALIAIKDATPISFQLEVAELPEVSDARALTVYLVVNEAVTNVLKHADASSIAVKVSPKRERLAVEITDDGIGGVPADAPLPALRDRVLSVGGSLGVRSAPGAGTTITALI